VEVVGIKATAADVRDTILQGLLPAILNSVMQHKLGAGLDDIWKWAKMAEKYGNSAISSGKDISGIKSTLNDLAMTLDYDTRKDSTPGRHPRKTNCSVYTSRRIQIIIQRIITNCAKTQF